MENPIPAFLESKLFNQPSASNASTSNDSRAPEPLMHKNRLQEYTQRSSIPLPVYQTTNEGSFHAPRFRSTVTVDGTSYTSENTFSHRKAAEQDAAKLALECISKKIKDEGCPLIREDTIFCKSILNEFAVKMNLEMPTYNTIQSEGLLPVFVSTLVFNGVTYSGETGRNKKEAEQLAARAALLSLLDDSKYGTLLSEIIKSKAKLYVALNKVKESSISHLGTAPAGASKSIHKNKEVETAEVTQSLPTSAIPQPNSGENTLIHKNKEVGTGGITESVPPSAILSPSSGANILILKNEEVETPAIADSVPTGAVQPSSGAKRPHHEFKIPKVEEGSECSDLPIAFVPSAIGQSSGVGESSSRKQRQKKKRARLQTSTQ